MTRLFSCFLSLFGAFFRSQNDLRLEFAALRHQLGVLDFVNLIRPTLILSFPPVPSCLALPPPVVLVYEGEPGSMGFRLERSPAERLGQAAIHLFVEVEVEVVEGFDPMAPSPNDRSLRRIEWLQDRYRLIFTDRPGILVVPVFQLCADPKNGTQDNSGLPSTQSPLATCLAAKNAGDCRGAP